MILGACYMRKQNQERDKDCVTYLFGLVNYHEFDDLTLDGCQLIGSILSELPFHLVPL
jgi:hypothetical protein